MLFYIIVRQELAIKQKRIFKCKDPLTIINSTISQHSDNLLIFPTLNQSETDNIIFGYEEKEGTLNLILQQYLKQKIKANNASIFLSIIGIQQQYLTDRLNFEWMNKNIQTDNQYQIPYSFQGVNKKKPIIKVHKNKEKIVIEHLSRHEISSTSDCSQILRNYFKLKQQQTEICLKRRKQHQFKWEKKRDKYNFQEKIEEQRNQALEYLISISKVDRNKQKKLKKLYGKLGCCPLKIVTLLKIKKALQFQSQQI